MHRRFNSTQRNYIIAGLCMILVIMGVGYAAFSSQLKISGTSNISGNFNIQITNIESVVPSEMGEDYPDGYNISEPTYTPDSATFSAGFDLPGSEIDYVVEISNLGNIKGQVTIGNLSCGDNPVIMCQAKAFDKNPLKEEPTNGFRFGNGNQDYSDIAFSIKPGEKHYILVGVYFDDVTTMPDDLDANIQLDLTYEQYVNPNITGETVLVGNQKVDVMKNGDGLYADEYEAGRYVYRGQNPDNYIMFNDELWRIIAKETDGTYKIIRNDILEDRAYDEANHRSTEKNSYCNNPSYGCGVYAAVEGTFSSPSGLQTGTVTEDSSIKIYLNDDYYVNDINSTAKEQMTSHSFNIGAVEKLADKSSDSIEKNIAGEKMYTWSGNVGLPNVSDILRASTNPLCTSATVASTMSTGEGNNECNSNYLLDRGDNANLYYWTINAYSHESFDSQIDEVWFGYAYSSYVYAAGSEADRPFLRAPRPVVFLKSTITLDGKGTISEPYTIN